MATQADLDRMQQVRRDWLDGKRVTEVRFGDRTVKYAELSIGVIDAEINRLKTELGLTRSRVRPVRLTGL